MEKLWNITHSTYGDSGGVCVYVHACKVVRSKARWTCLLGYESHVYFYGRDVDPTKAIDSRKQNSKNICSK